MTIIFSHLCILGYIRITHLSKAKSIYNCLLYLVYIGPWCIITFRKVILELTSCCREDCSFFSLLAPTLVSIVCIVNVRVDNFWPWESISHGPTSLKIVLGVVQCLSQWPKMSGITHFRLGHFRLTISGWPFQVGPFQVGAISGWAISGWVLATSGWGHFRLGHFRLATGHFRLKMFLVQGHFRLKWPFQVGTISGWTHFRFQRAISGSFHFRLEPFQVTMGHFRLGPFQVGAISGWGHFRLRPFQVGSKPQSRIFLGSRAELG